MMMRRMAASMVAAALVLVSIPLAGVVTADSASAEPASWNCKASISTQSFAASARCSNAPSYASWKVYAVCVNRWTRETRRISGEWESGRGVSSATCPSFVNWKFVSGSATYSVTG